MIVLAITLLLLLLTGLLVFQNLSPTPIRFLGGEIRVPGALLVMVGLAAGYWLTSLWHRMRFLDFQRTLRECGRTISSQDDRIRQQELELEKLRQESSGEETPGS